MTDEMRNKLADAFDSALNHKGIVVYNNGVEVADLDDKDTEVALKCNGNMDMYMAVYVIGEMIREGKIKFCDSYNWSKPLSKDIKYLEKLLKLGEYVDENK